MKISVLSGVSSLCVILAMCVGCSDDDSSVLRRVDASASGNSDAATSDAPQVVVRQDAGLNDAGKGDALSGSDAASGDAGLSVAEVVGFYSGDWGDMVLKEVNGEIWGAYTHDDGTIVGTFTNGVLVGWWSEIESRLPSRDAGEVEFRFVRRDGEVFIDGRWKYGVDDTWREDWDIGLVKMTPPPALVARFADPTAFKRHP
jgi:hypothetical protein